VGRGFLPRFEAMVCSDAAPTAAATEIYAVFSYRSLFCKKKKKSSSSACAVQSKPSIRGCAMSTLTVTAKGQITLGRDVLNHLGVPPGDIGSVENLPGGRIALKAARPKGQISDAFGFLKRENGPCLSIEEINELIAEGWAGKR
jgi:bifunctional DNA-binding transcriptional regulator/antitoxin component of YhaV-PrlF toxin-antitoxin module